MKIMLVMLAAVTVAVGGVLGLIRGSEALMLAITLPVAAIGLVFVLRLMLQLTSEGEEPDPDVVP
jgi:ribose/xylose/arabinose/galactoside ABC-type transport system permease subunit